MIYGGIVINKKTIALIKQSYSRRLEVGITYKFFLHPYQNIPVIFPTGQDDRIFLSRIFPDLATWQNKDFDIIVFQLSKVPEQRATLKLRIVLEPRSQQIEEEETAFLETLESISALLSLLKTHHADLYQQLNTDNIVIDLVRFHGYNRLLEKALVSPARDLLPVFLNNRQNAAQLDYALLSS